MQREYQKLDIDLPTVRIKNVSKSGVVHLSFSNTMMVPEIEQDSAKRQLQSNETLSLAKILKLKEMIDIRIAIDE